MSSTGDQIAERVEAAMMSLVHTVEGLGEAAVHRLPREGEWSAMQTLAHVAEIVPFWAKRARDVAEQRRGDESYDRTPAEYELRNAAVAEHGSDSLDTMLARLRAALAEGVSILRAIPEEGWARTAVSRSEQAVQSVAEIVEARIIRHVEAHAQQAAEAARASDAPAGSAPPSTRG
jgi:hypothetical protein